MEPGGVTRALPIDATLLNGVLLRLRRDAERPVARWTLGPHGSMELDVDFLPVLGAGRLGATWTSAVTLWPHDQVALARMTVEIGVRAVDMCEIALRPAGALDPRWGAHEPALRDLAHAALDEIAEELLWHATRGDVVRT